jgi:DNA-binding NtrC family response regulator
LDLDFEGPNPLRLIDAWRALAPHTRVIVESIVTDAGRMREAIDRGAYAFLVKPYSLAPLFDLVEKDIPPGPPNACRPAGKTEPIRRAAA